MAIFNCPQCNHAISDKAKKCINCGYKIKRQHKKIVIAVFGGISVFVILLFIVTFIASQVSVQQYFSLLSQSNFSCVVGNHHWESASCEKAKHCKLCNVEKGDPLGHKWKNADCSNAKMCLSCKKTDGDPLGHTVNIGNCARCNRRINNYEIQFTVIEESMSCMSTSYSKIRQYFNAQSSATAELYYCNLAKAETLNIKIAAGIARDICGDIPELTQVKQHFTDIDAALGEQIDVDLTLNNYISYANTLSEKIQNSVTAYNEAVAELNKILGG